MRDIRFRAFDTENKWYLPNIQNHIGNSKTAFGYMIKDLRYVVEQFTGLYDKNNKPIYEGDIIKIPENWDDYGVSAGEIYQIYFAFGGFRLKPKYKKSSKGFWLEDTKELEIIGNINENPELIKQ